MAAKFSVHITGDGVAARTCAHLLRRAGISVHGGATGGGRVPAVLLSDLAASLIGDVFECPSAFSEALRLDRRYVTWGNGERQCLPHIARVVSERMLLDALPPVAQDLERPPEDCDFVIYAASPLPEGVRRRRFGTREAASARVKLTVSEPGCEIESVENGWLFLIPAPEEVWLLGVGAPLETLLASSRYIAERIVAQDPSGGHFDSSPAMSTDVHGPDWAACGPVAVAFDPICGDGTAHAVRGAILISAAIGAMARGEDKAAVLAHYAAVLTLGMGRHLDLCTNYYRSGGTSAWWKGEVEALAAGRAWCAARMESAGPRRFRLEGFDLLPVNAAVLA